MFDRVAAPEISEGNVILVNTVPPNLPLTVEGEMRTPRVSAPLAKHPVTAGLSLTDLHVQEALRVKAGGDSVVLARAAESPLLVAFERARLRVLYIGFDLMASDLPYPRRFPRAVSQRVRVVPPRAPRVSRRRRARRCAAPDLRCGGRSGARDHRAVGTQGTARSDRQSGDIRRDAGSGNLHIQERRPRRALRGQSVRRGTNPISARG